MINFKYPVIVGEDANTGEPVIGFEHGSMFIFDPYLSECGRFQVDPQEAYGLPVAQADYLCLLNATIHTLSEAEYTAYVLNDRRESGATE